VKVKPSTRLLLNFIRDGLLDDQKGPCHVRCSLEDKESGCESRGGVLFTCSRDVVPWGRQLGELVPTIWIQSYKYKVYAGLFFAGGSKVGSPSYKGWGYPN